MEYFFNHSTNADIKDLYKLILMVTNAQEKLCPAYIKNECTRQFQYFITNKDYE